MKSELMTIGTLGDFGRRLGTVSAGFVSLVSLKFPSEGLFSAEDEIKSWG